MYLHFISRSISSPRKVGSIHFELSIEFLVNDQLDAQFFSMYLFQFPTCFKQPGAHH